MPAPVNLDVDLLRTLVTVADAGGFSRAADRLLRNQSTISLQIKRLEERVGAVLLERGPRHVRLTGEGQVIVDYARRILALNDELMDRVRQPEIAGLVRLGAPEDFATSHLPGVLARFAQEHPAVGLEVTCDLTLNLFDRFAAGDLDLALVKREPSAPLLGTRVWREPLVWVAAERGVAMRQGPLPLAVSPAPCVYRKRATDALDAAGRPWRIAYTCGALTGTHAAVRAGLGVTVLPKDMVPADLVMLDEEAGLPGLADTEMALLVAADIGPPAQRLREYVIRELERGRGEQAAG